MPAAFRLRLPLALNLGLALVVGVLLARRAQATATATAAVSVERPSAPRTATPSRMRYADFKTPSERRRSIIDRLRALGVPNDVLARVAMVDFQREWARKFDACHGDTGRLQAVQLDMELSKDAAMRAALGEEGFRQWDQNYMLWEAMSTKVDVTSAEASAIYGLKKTLQQRQHEIESARLHGTMDDAQINQAYDQAYAQYYTELKNVLGQERYDRSQQLDDAFVSDNLRSQLADLHPSDAQIQQLLAIEKASRQSHLELDHQFQDDLSSPAYQEKLNALNEAQNQEYERVLGPEAYDRYLKQQDPAYTQMKKYETHWGLDDGKVDFVYSTMKQYTRAVDDIKAEVHALQSGGQPVDWPATQQRLQALATNAQLAIQKNLAAPSFDALQRNGVLRFVRVQRAPSGPQ